MSIEDKEEKTLAGRYGIVLSVFKMDTDENVFRLIISNLTDCGVKGYVNAVWQEELRCSQLEKRAWEELEERLRDGQGIATSIADREEC